MSYYWKWKKSKSTCTWFYPRFICQESSVLLILLWFWLFALSSWKWSVIIFTGKLYLYWKIRSAGHKVSTAIYVHSTFEGCCCRWCCRHLLSYLFKYFVMLCHGQIIITFIAGQFIWKAKVNNAYFIIVIHT